MRKTQENLKKHTETEMIGVSPSHFERVRRITEIAAQSVDELVFSYGHLQPHDPERIVLQQQVQEILRVWGQTIMSYGAYPGDLWTVCFHTSEGGTRWQYPHSQYLSAGF